MPLFCAVFGCSNKGGRDKTNFFRIPAVKANVGVKLANIMARRRKLWIQALRRKDLTLNHETKINNARICSDHFISGKAQNAKKIGIFAG